jgi:regulator of protease activity HflC (stomatin/prohibitin superfamily)
MLEIAAVIVAVVVVAWVCALAFRRAFDRVTVFEFERGLRYDKGRYTGIVEPGRYWRRKRATRIATVDVRPTIVTVPGQEVITSDGVSIRISLTAEYELVDPAVAINEHENYREKLYVALQLALRKVVAETEIDVLLEQRAAIGERLAELTRGEIAKLGVRLRSAEAKDFMFPGELRKTFAQVVAARKEGLAALERARGETAALRNLANAARVMEGNPSLLQLRLFQELGRTGGNTVVLGLPSSATPLPIREGAAQPEIEPSDEAPSADE